MQTPGGRVAFASVTKAGRITEATPPLPGMLGLAATNTNKQTATKKAATDNLTSEPAINSPSFD